MKRISSADGESAYGDLAARHLKDLEYAYGQIRRLEKERTELEGGKRTKERDQALNSLRIAIAKQKRIRDDLEEGWAGFLNMLKEKMPAFANLYAPQVLDVSQIQQILKEKEILIAYHVQEAKTIAFVIGKDKVNVVEINVGRANLNDPSKKNVLVETIEAVRWTFWPNAKERRPMKDEELFSNLHELYRQYFQPLEPFLKADSELIIVPDNLLNFLPLGMLVAEYKNKRPTYLIERYPISYGYSSSLINPSLWAKREKSRSRKTSLLAVGNPYFGGKELSLIERAKQKLFGVSSAGAVGKEAFAPIPYTEDEVRAILPYFNGAKVLFGREATETAFKKEAQEACVIHLATHGMVNLKNVWNSKIVFALPKDEQEEDDGFLYLYEIAYLDLDADLIVLSVCNSGRGALKVGEGVLGMSRAFFYAGARSIVASLWWIPENEATILLEKKFYGYLAQGMDKRKALQAAQIDVIRTEEHMHPSYWAHAMLTGDVSPIKIEKPSRPFPMTFILPVAVVIALIFAAAYRRIKTQHASR